MNVTRGQIVLADYAHALVGSTLRPVLVVQSDYYNQRMTNSIVAQITSTLTRASDPAHLLIDVATADGRLTGLLHNSVVSCINLNTLHAQRIKRVIGHLSSPLMQRVEACLKAAMDLP
jgi:mRNA interferase MazF